MSASRRTTSPSTRFAANFPSPTAGDTPSMMTRRRPSSEATTTVACASRVPSVLRLRSAGGLLRLHALVHEHEELLEVERFRQYGERRALDAIADHRGRRGARHDDLAETLRIVPRQNLDE